MLVAVAAAAIAVLVGVRAGYRVLDVDEAVYIRTLRGMQHGDGYYGAMRASLIVKEHAPPRSLRAIRPPTEFLFMRLFPEKSWRYIAGIAFLASLMACRRLAQPASEIVVAAGVLLAGVWMIAASPTLFLHAEIYGLPFFLFGLRSFKDGKEHGAAWMIAGATVMRELFGLGLLLGFVFGKRRRAWIAPTAVVVALFAVHVVLTHRILSSSGFETALGNGKINARFILSALSPGDTASAWLFGIGGLLAGGTVLIRRRAEPLSRLLIAFAILMIPAMILATRTYWSYTFAPAFAALAPGALIARDFENAS